MRTKLLINIPAKALFILLMLVCGIAQAQQTAKEAKDSVETVKKQYIRRLNESIAKTESYLSSLPADSIDIGMTYAILDILKQKFAVKVTLANRTQVESRFPELQQGRVKLYGKFYAGKNTLPFTQDEINTLKKEPITSLNDIKYLLGVSMFCNELPAPDEYVTTVTAKVVKYKEDKTAIDPIIAGIVYANISQGKCKWRKGQLDTLKGEVHSILFKNNAGNLKVFLDMPVFYNDDKNLLGNVLASALLYHIGECKLFTYKMLFELLKLQNPDGGWHQLVRENDKSSFSASVAYLWLLLEIRDKIDCIDKVADSIEEGDSHDDNHGHEH